MSAGGGVEFGLAVVSGVAVREGLVAIGLVRVLVVWLSEW